MTHGFEAPPALETLLARLDQLTLVVGPAAAPRLGAMREELTRALGLRSCGDAPGAALAIERAMGELAALAAHVDPSEAMLMRAVVQAFGAALRRGEQGELERAADLMRERSGARKIEPARASAGAAGPPAAVARGSSGAHAGGSSGAAAPGGHGGGGASGPAAPLPLLDTAALPVLMALRVKGRATVPGIAAAADLGETAVRAALEQACARGAARSAGRGDSYALTDPGRRELAVLLAREAIDRAAIAALYQRFLTVDGELKAQITIWQLASTGEGGTAASGMGMASAAAGRLAGAESRPSPAPLGEIAGLAAAVARDLARPAPRFAPYARRLEAAARALAAGDAAFVASPHVDSLHQVWFELHEDLLATLGRARGS